jgi:4-hydroxy-3-polyprenylbenzoate decarboxylase
MEDSDEGARGQIKRICGDIIMKQRIVVAICGASGVIYGVRLLKALLSSPREVYAMISDAGRQVLAHEMGYQGEPFDEFIQKNGVDIHQDAALHVYDSSNLFAPPASGSFRHDGMVIAPCSMKTLGAVVSGVSSTLIHRAADVTLKEKRPLILITRETPLSAVHLRNMYQASISGATVMPPCPGFYFHPQTVTDLVDSLVGRILDHLKIPHHITGEWGNDFS